MSQVLNLEIFDTTLRDGDQSLPLKHHFPKGRKAEIAAEIASLGARTIEAGFPATAGDSEEVAEVAKTIGQSEFTITPKRIVGDKLESDAPYTFTPVVTGLSLARKANIKTTWEAVKDAKFPGIHTFVATAENHMRAKHEGMSKDQILDMAIESARYARALGGPATRVEFSCEAASTSDLKWLEHFSRTILSDEEAKIDVLNLPDTLGKVDGEDMFKMFSEATRWVIEEGRAEDVMISTHNHNDRGRAASNSIVAARAVSETAIQMGSPIPRFQVEVANGDNLGERVGNANHAVVALDLLLSIDTDKFPVPVKHGIDTLPTRHVAGLIMSTVGLEINPNAPVIGVNVNKDRSGVHTDGIIKGGASIYRAFNPVWFGHSVAGVIEDGKFQGSRGRANLGDIKEYKSEILMSTQDVFNRVSALAMELDEKAIERLVVAINSQAKATGRIVTDSEIEAFATTEVGEEIADTVISHEFSGGIISDHSYADVVLKLKDGQERIGHHAGTKKGPVDAAVQAINESIGFKGDIEDIDVFSLEPGSDASAGAIAIVTDSGHRFTAYATGASLDKASVAAYIQAFNLIQRVNARS